MRITGAQKQTMLVAMMGALLAGTATVATAQKPATRPTSQAVAKAENHREKMEKAAYSEARSEAKSLLKDVKLNTTEKASCDAIETKYKAALKDMQKADVVAEKRGIEDLTMVRKIDALRLELRSDLRAALTSSHQALFDNNVIILEAMKARVSLLAS